MVNLRTLGPIPFPLMELIKLYMSCMFFASKILDSYPNHGGGHCMIVIASTRIELISTLAITNP